MKPNDLTEHHKRKKQGEDTTPEELKPAYIEAEREIQGKQDKINQLTKDFDFKQAMTDACIRAEKWLKEQEQELDPADTNKVVKMMKANNDFLAQMVNLIRLGLIKYEIDRTADNNTFIIQYEAK